MDYKDYTEFFAKIGDQYLHPTAYGESFYHFTIEEMYQHFKERMMTELAESIDRQIKALELEQKQQV